ncbi:MAG: asparagine synthase (glutamine-hydrolyzing) [Desulfobacterales bacterium]
MCGIAGLLHLKGGTVDAGLIHKMCDVITHRGPDDQGYFIEENIALGMRRLSIIDLGAGHQPIYNEDKSVVVVFNGEIYNYKELRKDLENRSHRFYSHSDTEVIVHLYEEHGEKCIDHLRGMFAVALWDKKKRRLLLVRDRVGQKPLYYTIAKDTLYFGSEIKQLIISDEVERELNFESLDTYFSVGYVPGPETLFRNIGSLSPGHYMKVENGVHSIHKYWDINYSEKLETFREAEIIEKLQELITEAVRLRLVSDVPLGAFLSGGMDSSTVVGIMSKISNSSVKTFSVGFPPGKFDESPYARRVAKHFQTDHYEYTMEKLSTDLLEHLVWHHDEPVGDSSCIPLFLLSRLAKQHVTVALSGEGADELFAGYHQYPLERLGQYYDLLPKSAKHIIYKFVKALPLSNKFSRPLHGFWAAKQDPSYRSVCWMGVFNEEEKKKLFNPAAGFISDRPYSAFSSYWHNTTANNYLEKALYVDEKIYLPDDLLMKVDKMAMANSLEVRSPFLDHKLIEFVAQIPERMKLRGSIGKYVLKQAVKQIVPEEIIQRRKHGFNVPIQTWLTGWLEEYARDILSESNLRQQGIINPEYVHDLWSSMRGNTYNYDRRIWLLLMFQIWYGIFIERNIDVQA